MWAKANTRFARAKGLGGFCGIYPAYAEANAVMAIGIRTRASGGNI